MTVEEFYSAVGTQGVKLIDLHLEGMFSPAFEVRSGDRVLLQAEFDKRNDDWFNNPDHALKTLAFARAKALVSAQHTRTSGRRILTRIYIGVTSDRWR
jgi:hypothetical protein